MAAQPVTIKGILTAWETVANAHQQTQAVGFGERADRSSAGEVAYPSVWMETPYLFDTAANGFKTYSFAFLVLDRPKEDDEDKFEIVNKTELIGTAIVQRFKLEIEKKFPAVELLDGWDGVSLEDFGDDAAAGWRIEFRLKAPGPVGKCDQPFDPFTI